MILVLDPDGRRVRTMAPRRAQEKVERGRATWCHQPRHLPDRLHGTIVLDHVPRDPVPERSHTLLLDAHGVPFWKALDPRVARQLVRHPERWVRSRNGQAPLVTVVGTLRHRAWPRCLMLTQALPPQAIDELLLAATAEVVDEAVRLRTLQDTLERLSARVYSSADLTLRQLRGAWDEIARLGACDPGWQALSRTLADLVAPMAHTVLSQWRDDPLRVLYATLWVLGRLVGQPDPVRHALTGLRTDLAGMSWPEALAIVAEAQPSLYAAWARATRKAGSRPSPAAPDDTEPLPTAPRRRRCGSRTSVHDRRAWDAARGQ